MSRYVFTSEEQYGADMLALARREGHMARRPEVSSPKRGRKRTRGVQTMTPIRRRVLRDVALHSASPQADRAHRCKCGENAIVDALAFLRGEGLIEAMGQLGSGRRPPHRVTLAGMAELTEMHRHAPETGAEAAG